jgi:hypothetical protein
LKRLHSPGCHATFQRRKGGVDPLWLPLADAFLRLAIQFADGRAVTNFDPPTIRSDAPEFNHPMLSEGPGDRRAADDWFWDGSIRDMD